MKKPSTNDFIIGKILKSENILFIKGISTKEEIISFLINSHSNNLDNCSLVQEKVLKRESIMPTSVGLGIAIPHVISSHVSKLLLAIGISQNGIMWDSTDQILTHIVILILSPEKRREYYKLLGELNHILNTENKRELIVSALDEKFIYNLFISGVS